MPRGRNSSARLITSLEEVPYLTGNTLLLRHLRPRPSLVVPLVDGSEDAAHLVYRQVPLTVEARALDTGLLRERRLAAEACQLHHQRLGTGWVGRIQGDRLLSTRQTGVEVGTLALDVGPLRLTDGVAIAVGTRQRISRQHRHRTEHRQGNGTGIHVDLCVLAQTTAPLQRLLDERHLAAAHSLDITGRLLLRQTQEAEIGSRVSRQESVCRLTAHYHFQGVTADACKGHHGLRQLLHAVAQQGRPGRIGRQVNAQQHQTRRLTQAVQTLSVKKS